MVSKADQHSPQHAFLRGARTVATVTHLADAGVANEEELEEVVVLAGVHDVRVVLRRARRLSVVWRGSWREEDEECRRAQAVVVTRVAVFGKGVPGKRPVRTPSCRPHSRDSAPAKSPPDNPLSSHLRRTRGRWLYAV